MSDATGMQKPQLYIQSTDLLDVYRSLVAQGVIQSHDEQIRVIMELRQLRKDLEDYVPSLSLLPRDEMVPPESKNNEEPWWTVKPGEPTNVSTDTRSISRIQTHAEALANLDTPRGILLIGPAGTGKSFLMQLFYDSLPTAYKSRKHYSHLVLEIYRGVWGESKRRSSGAPDLRQPVEPRRWDTALRDSWRRLIGTDSSTTGWGIHEIARRLVTNHWLLFFDEIQLRDVSSAGLLCDVLSWYWRMGGVVIGTSNKLPSDLYSNGVQRERLEPFVHALQARCPVPVMREERDWRRVRAPSAGGSTWFVHDEPGAEAVFMEAVRDAAGGAEGQSETLTVFGRPLNQELGPADYISIASAYHTLAIQDIPVFPIGKKNEARRFISLLDACWECRCRVIGLAAAKPDDLFFPDAFSASASGSDSPEEIHTNDELLIAESFTEGLQQSAEGFRPNIASYDLDQGQFPVRDIPPSAGVMLKPLSIFTGEEEPFAYARAVSRIHELASAAQQKEMWTPTDREARRWETATPGTTSSSDSVLRTPRRPREDPDADFGYEAANERPTRRGVKVEPPRIKEQYVWGAREDWGRKAGEWGRGAGAYRIAGEDYAEQK
ncbi:hypothetical protein DACRYDRAFT_88299 [Dacryopinax primogenitus]|uniref:AAA+ ATPase domain-containing protein n=1 Tax=Dacryopinax primogenitus (strain DJM 731) TaxID=1858805 RepID=M5GBC6_DACPD|nr:uncharacterized protein DACRYDRAFT_88299 [Dacryopinax primogenitus]EJU03352.1 hypothetical protein DACRYDRAFT_88299 [Dacryopinax primogenitus]